MPVTLEYERDGGDEPLTLEVSGPDDFVAVQEFCRIVNDAAGSMDIIGPDGEDVSNVSGRYDPHDICSMAYYLDGRDTEAKIAFMYQQRSFGALENFDRAFKGEFNNMEDFGLCMARDNFNLDERLEYFFDGLKFGWACITDFKVVTAEGGRPEDDDKIYVFDVNAIAHKPGIRM